MTANVLHFNDVKKRSQQFDNVELLRMSSLTVKYIHKSGFECDSFGSDIYLLNI